MLLEKGAGVKERSRHRNQTLRGRQLPTGGFSEFSLRVLQRWGKLAAGQDAAVDLPVMPTGGPSQFQADSGTAMGIDDADQFAKSGDNGRNGQGQIGVIGITTAESKSLSKQSSSSKVAKFTSERFSSVFRIDTVSGGAAGLE